MCCSVRRIGRGCEHRFGLHVGQIAACIRFAVTLAPTLGAVENAGQEALALCRCAVFDERWAKQVFAHVVHACGCLSARVFLGPNDLLVHRRATSAVCLGPAETDPPGATELELPCHAHVETHLFVAGPTAAFEFGVVADNVSRKPLLDEAAEVVIGHRRERRLRRLDGRHRTAHQLGVSFAAAARFISSTMSRNGNRSNFTVAGRRSSMSSGVQRVSLYIARTSLGWLHTAILLPTAE